MDEKGWLESSDPASMLALLMRSSVVTADDLPDYVVSDRKLRLYACACNHLAYGDVFPDQVLSSELGEEGSAIADPMGMALAWARHRDGERLMVTTKAAILRDIVGNPFRPVKLLEPVWEGPVSPKYRVRLVGAGDLRRFQPLPAWLTEDVECLAQAAYGERQPDGTLEPVRLLILADALEEMGCALEGLLGHLRNQHHRCGPHVPGCWALDCLLGRQ